MRLPTILLLSAALTGCKPPPDAPDKLEELCGYLFEHLDDEDDVEMVAGLDNLDVWLGNHLHDTLEGYTISSLDETAVQTLDNQKRSVSSLVGAAVATESNFTPTQITEALILEDQEEIFVDSYQVYNRDWDGDPACFPGRDCTFVEADLHAESSWAGLITVSSHAHNQYRWLDADGGWMMAQRSWMVEPAEVSWDEIQVNAQYYLAITLPASGGAVRLQSTWIDADYGVLPVGEDYAKQQIVKSMQGTHDQLETWLEEND